MAINFTTYHVVAGPSKWELMQSLFTRSMVRFTLDSGIVIEGQVKTLHDHGIEDTIVEEDSFTYSADEFHDWLILVEPRSNVIYSAAIEYHERTRTGAAVWISYSEYESLREDGVPVDAIYRMPSIWARMMDPISFK
jgi:hypothetical protein